MREPVTNYHAIIDEWYAGFMKAKDKDAFTSGMLCAMIDAVGSDIVRVCIKEASKFERAKKGKK